MKTGWAVALFLAGAALGLAVGLTSTSSPRGTDASDRPPEKVRDECRRLESELRAERTARSRAEARAEKAEKTASSLERKIAALESGIAASTAPPGPEKGEAAPRAGARFFASAWDGVLADVDWKALGTNMSRMAPLIDRVIGALGKGEPAPTEAVIEIQKLNQPLVLAALKASRKVPGTGVNGSFSHPAFMANAMAAALEAAGLPLDEGQAKNLEAIGERYLKLDEERLRAYDDRVFELQKLIEEVDLRDRFLREAFALLSPAQEAALRTEQTRDRVRADIFSAALVYVGRIRFLTYSDPADLARKVLANVRGEILLDDAEREKAKGLVGDWAAEIPSDLLSWRPDLLDRQGLVRLGIAHAWAKQTLGLARSLADGLALEGERRARARKIAGVIFGMPEASDGR